MNWGGTWYWAPGTGLMGQGSFKKDFMDEQI
jgi:hypothetical protein